MVRPCAAGAHSSLYGAATSTGNRTRQHAGLHALSFPLAALVAQRSSRRPRRAGRGIRQLQGFEAPVAAWESELLPARLDAYDMTWLDDLCLTGRAVWTRLTSPAITA